jgi:hypothetical protein
MDSGMTFREDLEFHCRTADVNALYGMLVAQSEGGVFSNPKDTDPWAPLNLSKACDSGGPPAGPKGVGGLVQGAARWSTLARTFCPQIAGVVIDDFWSNYQAPSPAPSSAAVTTRVESGQPTTRGDKCSSCPADHAHMYGSACAGFYCCPVVPDAHCTPPKGNGSDCCLWPGEGFGCQGVTPCAGVTDPTDPPCGSGLAPGPAPPSGPPQRQNLTMMREIKAALMGKSVRSDGTVDHASPALTPHLQLHVVTYQQDISALNGSVLVSEGIVDGISFWINGPSQRHIHAELTSLVAELRTLVPAEFPIFTGGYITYSSIGWTEPAPFYDILAQSVGMYDANEIQGFYAFAGSVLRDMNSSLWQEWDLSGHLAELYFPHLGRAHVTLLPTAAEGADDAVAVAATIPVATATVVYNGTTHVTRKETGGDYPGSFSFGGWVGKLAPALHTVTIVAPGFKTATAAVQLRAGEAVSITIKLTPLHAASPPIASAEPMSGV